MLKKLLRGSALLVLSICLGTLGGCVYGGSFVNRESEIFQQTLPLENGGTFSLENVNGSITVGTWDRPDVKIEAEKKALTRQKLDDIRIEIKHDSDRIEVKTRYPHLGFFNNNPGEVIYNITLPKEVRAQLKSVNGRIMVDGLRRDLKVETVNGSVEIEEARGTVDAETVNGSIHASLREVSGGDCRFSTTNGSITVRVPENVNARIEGNTVNGNISTDFPLSISGRVGKNLSGQIGNGGRCIRLVTVNGGISLYRI